MTNDENRNQTLLTQEEKSNFGKKLKTTRENMGLSLQEASSRLCLSPRFITMLENEDLRHSSLPPIYLRGYLRSYARLLNIPEQELLAAIEDLDPQPVTMTTPTAVTSDSLSLSFPLENNAYYVRIATFLISLALLTSITTWWYHHANTNPSLEIALNQPLKQQAREETQNIQASSRAYNNSVNENPMNLNSLALENTINSAHTEASNVPAAAISISPQKQVTLAAAAQNLNRPAQKLTQGQETNEDDSNDEQE